MEKLSRKIANAISLTLNYNSEKEEIIAYGMIAIIQSIVTISMIILLGLILGVLFEALTVMLSVSILRKYSGGSHANSIELCTATAIVYSIGCALIVRYLLQGVPDIKELFLLSAFTFIGAFWIVYKKAPVDSPNKPIKSEKKIKRMRRGSYIVLAFYFLLNALLIIFSDKNVISGNLALSMQLGIIWQSFTLTNLGTKLSDALNVANKNVI